MINSKTHKNEIYKPIWNNMTCPCCHKEVELPPPADQTEDMSNLFSCDHCQSVLKCEGDSLKVVFESKADESDEVEQAEDKISPSEQEMLSEEKLLSADIDEDIDSISSSLGHIDEPAEEAIHEQAVAEESAGLLASADGAKDGLLADEDSLAEPSTKPLAEEPEEAVHEPAEETSHENLEDLSSQEEEAIFKEEEEKEPEGTDKEQDFSDVEEKEPEGTDKEQDFSDVEEKEPEGTDKEQDFSDVESYGNSTSMGVKGFLLYDLMIEGIDSSEIKKQIFLILEDPRFNWSAKEIMQSEKEGKLLIKNLNPVKVFCLLSELNFVSVKLSWRQYRALSAPQEQAP